MSPKLKMAVRTVALLCFAGLPQVGMAQTAKIAVIDTEAVTFMSDEGKAANEKIEKRVQAMSAEMDKMRKSIEEKETNLRTQDRLMAATRKAQLQKEIEDEKIQFDRKNQDYQKEIEEMQNALMAPISAKIQAELAAFVNEKGYDLLLDVSVPPANIVWANPANNITKDVLGRVNESFKKASAAAPAAPATAKPAAAVPAASAPATGK
jgi:outer membrane protein